jgi:hypothetical protein
MRYCLLALLLLFALPLFAQQAPHACAEVADPAARLACYDKAFPPLPGVMEAAAEKAKADFGLHTSRESLRSSAPGAQPDQEQIEARVDKVDHGAGQRSFQLENGQVWMQVEARSSGHVGVGDTVQVRKGVLGGFQLITPQGIALRVRRMR